MRRGQTGWGTCISVRNMQISAAEACCSQATLSVKQAEAATEIKPGRANRGIRTAVMVSSMYTRYDTLEPGAEHMGELARRSAITHTRESHPFTRRDLVVKEASLCASFVCRILSKSPILLLPCISFGTSRCALKDGFERRLMKMQFDVRRKSERWSEPAQLGTDDGFSGKST